MDNGTKVHRFLQGIKSTELEAVINVVQAQPRKYETDFEATVFYLGQMVTKKSLLMQFVHIAKTRSQPMRAKVAAFTKKVESKKHPEAVWNSMTNEQQTQVRKCVDAKIAALEAKLMINSQDKESDVKKSKGETPKEP